MRSEAHRRPSAPRAGFVLSEALATLAVSGAVLLGLASLTNLVSRHAARVAEAAESAEATGRTLAALGRDIGRASRARWAGPSSGRPFVFAGGPEQMLFALDRPADAPSGPTVAVQIESRGGDLLRAEAPLPPTTRTGPDLAFAPADRLYRGRSRLRFAYVMAASATTPEVLLDDWALPDAMPVAVRLSLCDPETGAPTFSVRVPMRIEAEAGCSAAGKAFCSRPAEQDQDDDEPSTAAIVNALQGRRP